MPDEDAALESSLSRVENFVDYLSIRCELARERAEDSAKGTRAAARAHRELEEVWADLEAARRLRETVAAAVASARAQVAVIEAEACAAVGAAFKQFKKDRAWRRRATRPAGAQGRPRKTSSRRKSPNELGKMVAIAMQTVAYVLADRNRLTEQLVDTRTEAAELRGLLANAGAENPTESVPIRRRIEVCDGHAAYLEQQLLASATAAKQLVVGLRKLFDKLPEPITRAARLLCGPLSWDNN
jgi:hypothetical protein